MQDIVIIGGGAAGLFCADHLPKNLNTTILEKSSILGTKVLLSGGSRCNFSNANIDPLLDYFGQDKRSLPSLFHKFGNQEMKEWLEENHIPTKQEETGRLILQSEKAKDLNNLLISKAQANDTEICLNQTISKIEKTENGFAIHSNEQIFETKNLIIATGGKSFPQIGATDFGLQIAQQFGLETTKTSPGLCGIQTKEDLSPITGNAIICTINLLHNNKIIYQETGNLLFTHRGISGPIVFNTTNALEEYCITKKIGTKQIPLGRLGIYEQFTIQLTVDPTTLIKKITTYFNLNNKNTIDLSVKSVRPREEAKVMMGGVHMKEIKPSMESKKVPGLYFIGEVLDITGKTGGYNLQRCWTSAYACAKSFT